jgi:callose synthase
VHSIRAMVKSTTGDARAGEVQDLLSLILSLEQGFMWDDNYATSRLDKLSLDANAVSVLSKLYGLLAVQV